MTIADVFPPVELSELRAANAKRSEPILPSRNIESNAIYSVREAAFLLSLAPKVMREKLVKGQIKGSRALGNWRVRGSELLKFA